MQGRPQWLRLEGCVRWLYKQQIEVRRTMAFGVGIILRRVQHHLQELQEGDNQRAEGNRTEGER